MSNESQIAEAGLVRNGLLRPGGLLMVCFGIATGHLGAQTNLGRLEMKFTDNRNGGPVPCRVHLKDSAGKPIKAGALPFFRDHFVCNGKAILALAPGNYSYEIERGPEYLMRTGSVAITANAAQNLDLKLERLTDLAVKAGGRAICTCIGHGRTSNC